MPNRNKMNDLKEFFSLTNDFCCLASTAGYFRWVNPTFERMLGWTEKELLDHPFLSFIHPDDIESTKKEVENLKSGLETISFENRFRCRDGDYMWLQWNASTRENGEIYALARDVSHIRTQQQNFKEKIHLLEMAENLAKVGYWKYDLNTHKVEWSAQVYEIHGVTEEEFTPSYEGGIAFYHPDDREKVRDAINHCIITKRRFSYQLRLQNKKGDTRIVRSIGECELDEFGEPVSVIGAFYDVTDSETQTKMLKEQTETLANVTHRLREMNRLNTVTFDSIEETFKQFLFAGMENLGLSTGIISKVELDEYEILAILSNKLRFEVGTIFDIRDTYCYEVLHERRCIAYHHVGEDEKMSSHPIYVNLKLESYIGAPIIVFGKTYGTLNFTDEKPRDEPFKDYEFEFVNLLALSLGRMIEQEQSKNEITKQKNFFEAIFLHAPDGMVIADRDRNIITVNPAMERLFGYKSQELVGHKTKILYANPEDFGRIGNEEYNEPSNALTNLYEMTYRRKDFQSFPSETIGSVIKDLDGKVLGYLAQIRDISERKAVDRMKSEFISRVSHELRTPLTSIKGSIQLLLHGGYELNSDLHDMLDIVYRNCERLGFLVNDLLDFEKIRSGFIEYNFSTNSLDEIIDNAIKTNQQYAKKLEQTIVMKKPPKEETVYVDSNRIQQVLSNLLSNAAKFSPSNQEIAVETEEYQDYVEIRVIDWGKGVPEDYQEKIFDAFTQVDASDARKENGTGLGLSICKHIIEAHGGKLKYQDNPEGGSIFSFSLPKKKETVK